MLYLCFKFVRKFKFCVSPLVKRYLDLFDCDCFHRFCMHESSRKQIKDGGLYVLLFMKDVQSCLFSLCGKLNSSRISDAMKY